MALVEIFKFLFDLIFHLDKNLSMIIQSYGLWTYAILFLIIFVETGLVIMPFLPGDSLLFVAGTFAAIGAFNIWSLLVLLIIAAVLGDTVNYFIGYRVGPKIYKAKKIKIIKKEYLDQAHLFYETHGGKAIVLSRFIPILRTFTPFVAGIANMRYRRFIFFNIIGGILWVGLFTLGGFFFGNLPFVKENLSIVLILIMLVSGIPIFYEMFKQYRSKRNEKKTGLKKELKKVTSKTENKKKPKNRKNKY